MKMERDCDVERLARIVVTDEVKITRLVVRERNNRYVLTLPELNGLNNLNSETIKL